MRRIYESGALERDDESPFVPGGRDDVEPQAMRSVDATAWSRRLVPDWLRTRAVSVDIEAPTRVPADAPVPFVVTMRNAAPFPVTVVTRSPKPWEWYVDGVPAASHVASDPPDEPRGFRFGRGETKRFRHRWDRTFQVADREWESADPGEYTISVRLNVAEADRKGLADETTVHVGEG
jgi:hypothetical protein